MKSLNIEEILKRMRKIYAVEQNKDLAECLGYKQPAISGWLSRGTIPLDVLLTVVSEKKISWDWLIDGKEEQGRELNPLENLVLTAFNQLDDNAKISILSQMHNGGVATHNTSISQQTGDNGQNYFNQHKA